MQENSEIQLLQSLSDAVVKVAEKASSSVVNVGTGRRSGTGIVWSKDGLIVTANHVVGRAGALEIRLDDGRKLESRVVGRDQYTDVALLKIDADNLKPIEVGQSRETKTGQLVLALANPFGEKASATLGIVTSPSRTIQGYWGVMMEDAVITDAKLNPGYSGGPLVDASGKLVGMNVAYFSGRGVAVSVNTLKDIVPKLSKDGRIRKGFLGVATDTISLPEEIAKKPDINQEEGVLVLSVEPESPAKKAGVRMGDIIVKLGDKPIESLHDLHKQLTDRAIGSTTTLWVLRGEVLTPLKITPTEFTERITR